MYQGYTSQYNGNNDTEGGSGGGGSAPPLGRPRESPRPTGSAGGGPPVAGRRYNQQQQQPVFQQPTNQGSIHTNVDLGSSEGGGGGGGYGQNQRGNSGHHHHHTSNQSSSCHHCNPPNSNNNNRLITPTQHNRYGPQLRMSIIQCTSEDDAFPISELSCRTSYTSGWHSAKNPEYPQEIGFRFEGEVDLQSVRILCHESKIPTRVEVYVAEASDEDRRGAQFPTYEAAVFRRLGHFNLNSNVENGFAARELKTVNVRRQCMYLKLIIRKNHINNINVFHQVGIVALAAHGTLLSTYTLPHGISTRNEILIAGDDEVPIEQIYISKKRSNHPGSANFAQRQQLLLQQQQQSSSSADQQQGGDGQQHQQQLGGSNNDMGANDSSSDGFDCTFGGTMDATTGLRVRELSLHKARAVQEEDYDLARALKSQIELLKDYGSQIALLEARKDVAVDAEDYGTAKDLKKQIDALRAKGSNRQHGSGVIHAASAGQAAASSYQQQHPQQRAQPTNNNNNGGHGGQSPAWLDEKPVGGGGGNKAPVAFDDQPVGGGGGGKKPFVPFDDRPVGGGGGGGMGGMGGGGGMMGESGGSQPQSQSQTPRRQPPPKRAPNAKRPPSPPPQKGPDGEVYEQVTAQFISSGNDEVAIGGGGGGGSGVMGASGSRTDDSGIVSTSSAPRGPVVRASAEGLDDWEASFNRIIESNTQGGQSAPEALPSSKLAEYKEYISLFGSYGTSCLFSKQWQLREGVIRAIISETGYPLLADHHKGTDHDLLTVFLQYCGAKGMGVHDSLANVFFATGDALKAIASRELNPRPPTASQLASSLTPLLPELMAKAGDSNARVRDQAASVLLTLATSSFGAEKVSAVAIAEPPMVGKKPIAFRVQLARLVLISSLVDEVGLQEKSGAARGGVSSGGSGLTVEAVMTKVCLPSLLHSHQDVREAAQHLIATLHHKSKQPIEKYLVNVKPQQRQLIDEQISNYVAGAPPLSSQQQKSGTTSAAATPRAAVPKPPKVYDDDDEAPKKKSSPAKKPKEAEMVSSSLSVGKDGHQELITAARMASAGNSSTTSVDSKKKRDRKKTCQFCHLFDERFTDDIMDLHYVQSCPMLCPCPLCGQVSEISQLQMHLTTECDRRTLVQQCPRCLEAVRAEDLDAHVEAKECIHVDPKKFNLCPLCHDKLPPGIDGWEKHLSSAPGCPNNPRRFDGGNGEEFEL